jgi:hypothetical protein
MNPFSAAELTAMRSVQNVAMMDTCTVRTWTPAVDDYGTEIAGYTDVAGVACGLDVTGTRQKEQRRADGTIAILAAVLRLSIDDGVGLTAKDRVTVTHRHGEALNPVLVYGIDGAVERGPTGIVVRLVEVQ